MKNKIIISIFLLVIISIFIGWRSYKYYNPSSVLIIVPNEYRGKLVIKEDKNKGRMLDSKALEKCDGYVYEFDEIINGTVFVENISFLLNSKTIVASQINVTPLELKIISKENNEICVIIEAFKNT